MNYLLAARGGTLHLAVWLAPNAGPKPLCDSKIGPETPELVGPWHTEWGTKRRPLCQRCLHQVDRLKAEAEAA